MQGFNYGLVDADEWLNQDSDTNNFLREANAQVIRATGYQGNGKFFLLVNIPEDTLFLNFDALDWKKAPKGYDTVVTDVLSPEELSRGVLHPVEEALENMADNADKALTKAASIGSGLALLVGVPVGLWIGYQVLSALRSKKGE